MPKGRYTVGARGTHGCSGYPVVGDTGFVFISCVLCSLILFNNLFLRLFGDTIGFNVSSFFSLFFLVLLPDSLNNSGFI